MFKKLLFLLLVGACLLMVTSCIPQLEDNSQYPVTLVTLDPGHFHAALVQKTMNPEINPTVYVYGPKGEDIDDHMNRIKGFNTRQEAPTHWNSKVYKNDDYLSKATEEKKGNVVVLAGNNSKKTEYIKASVDAGLNVLSDKPMCINAKGFDLLKAAFESAKKNDVLLYDIMTERHEITTMLQKELAHTPAVFGELVKGSVDKPAIVKESVHHFFKYVSGNPLKRPAWYFDTTQQGEGIVDVTTHLVDLVQWEAFPEQVLDYTTDVKIKQAKRWPTMISKDQYKKVTRLDDFPAYLKGSLDSNGQLPCYANGEIDYTLKGVHAKIKVLWNYEAPAGAKDTHYSIMRGTKANVIIRQGKDQNYKPALYVEAANGGNANQLAATLPMTMMKLQKKYPGVTAIREGNVWKVVIPQRYHVGHEAHFGQVADKYLKYLKDGQLPEWEVPNMLAKYYTTTTALKMAEK